MEYYETDALTTTYIFTGSDRIAKIEGSTTEYYLKDHLGNARALIADNGTVSTTMDYWPYGAMLSQPGTGDTKFKFTGHERDDESGLDYMLARMNDPGIGRFLQMDPLADKYPHLSPYVYVAGNPMKFVDPDGAKIMVTGNKATTGAAVLAQAIGEHNTSQFFIDNDGTVTPNIGFTEDSDEMDIFTVGLDWNSESGIILYMILDPDLLMNLLLQMNLLMYWNQVQMVRRNL